jgi:outer membrane protein OmpA-like peptidoglycan-associated protein
MSSDDPLRSAELGDRTLWVINGPDALLACIISGTPPRTVRDELMALLETIHARYGDRFAETDGALTEDLGLRVLMQQALREELDEDAKRATTTRSKAPIYWSLAIALLLILTGWRIWHGYQQREFESQMVNLFRAQPGYVVSSSSREQGALVIDGLRDPGSAGPDAVLAAHGHSDQDIRFRLKPFWSLEPSLMLQRLRTSLKLTDSTGIDLNGRTLLVNGVLGAEQSETLKRLAGTHPLIDTVDLSGTRLDAGEAMRLARVQLAAPDSVEMTANEGRIALSGWADIAWYREKSAAPPVFGGWEIDFAPLLSDLQNRLLADAAEFNNTEFRFTRQDRLTAESITDIDIVAGKLVDVLQSANLLGIQLVVTLVGEVDGTGTAEQNARVARNRVRVARDRLTEAGVDPARIRAEYPAWNPGDENLEQRRVTIRISEGESP